MLEDESAEPGLAQTLERVVSARAEGKTAELVSTDWRGRVNELEGDALRAFWAEALGFARREIGRYARGREQDEPVMADGYDAEGVVQAAFERLLCREAGS